MTHYAPVLSLAALLVLGTALMNAQTAASAPSNSTVTTDQPSQAQPGTNASQNSAPQPKPATAAPGSSGSAASPSVAGAQADGADPLLDLPPLPQGKVTLVGGKVANVDRIRNHLTVEPFGGKKMKVAFDERTHIYRNGIETTVLGIHKGDRVYVDTMLDGHRVFAKNIRVQTDIGPADARGQVVSYNSGDGTLVVRDELSTQPVTLHVSSTTAIRRDNGQASRSELQPGALVEVKFSPDRTSRGVADEISILAVPGTTFQFAGPVTFLDLRSNTMAVRNQSDNKTYELSFDPGQIGMNDNLVIGAEVDVKATFDGRAYKANSVTITQARSQ